MSLSRVLYVVGVIFMVWALVSGIYVSYQMTDGEGTFTSGYSFKIGLFLLGLVMAYLGRNFKKSA